MADLDLSPNASRYLSLLKKSLLNELNLEVEARVVALASGILQGRSIDARELVDIRNSPWFKHMQKVRAEGWTLDLKQRLPDGQTVTRHELRFLSENCHTMMGRRRLDHLHGCLDTVVREGIAGDFAETGVWRGGGTIFLRGYLAAHGITDRAVWVADSFEGLPVPSRAEDASFDLSKDKFPSLAVGLDAVKELFARYELLDEQVKFLKGWFRDTLPSAPIEALSILRLDGDLYESTMDALTALYDRVTPGGFVIIDDYKALEPCERAVNEFRTARGIDAPMSFIDTNATFWRKG